MCGIVGFWDTSCNTQLEQFTASLTKMRDTLTHRGPDGAGLWVDVKQGIGLGHRRLAILDLSEHGEQPMFSASGRYALIFNGEIYNHLEIKQKLEAANLAHTWRGHSDTEIILAAFEAYGIEESLTQFVGMFAIALWDRQQNLLYLIRDRLGEKPLYYGWLGKHLVFGSELKSLKAHFAWQQAINAEAVNLLMQYTYIPAPYSIYEDIYKVMPGHMLVINQQQDVRDIAYWQLKNVINQEYPTPSVDNAISELERILKRSTGQQMLADVPVGAFLSGGIDSSTIAALMQAQSSRPIKTFTIGFDDPAYNEAEQAKLIAKHLGTEHTELYLNAEQTHKIIPQLADFYDEPFADSSQLPTYIVAKLTREHVTVSLSGDGGDELFGGYTRYLWTTQLWKRLAFLPYSIRSIIASLAHKLPVHRWDQIFALINKFLPKHLQQRHAGEKMHKAAHLCKSKNLLDAYKQLLTQWDVNAKANLLPDLSHDLQGKDFVSNMMYMDTMRYLPDDIMVKVDRAAMAVSLETRMPFLDHRVVEYAWSLPFDFKVRDAQNKWILRQVLNKYVPPQLYDRPKMGFGVPIHQWIRGPLQTWADDLLSKTMLNKHNLLDQKLLQNKWQEHKSGAGNWQHHLWIVLIFQSWYEAQHG